MQKTKYIQNHATKQNNIIRNPDNPHYLYVRYKNKRRRLFINDKQGDIGIIAIGKRKKGHVFSDWGGIDKIFDKDC